MSKLGKGSRKKGNYRQGGDSSMHIAPIVAAGAKMLGKAVLGNLVQKGADKLTGEGGDSGVQRRGDYRNRRIEGVGSYNPVVSNAGGDGTRSGIAGETYEIQDVSGSGGTKTAFYDEDGNQTEQKTTKQPGTEGSTLGEDATQVKKGDGTSEKLNQDPSSGGGEPGSAKAAENTAPKYARFGADQMEGGKSEQPIVNRDGSVNTTLSKLIPTTMVDRMREKAKIRRERKQQVDIGSIDRLTGSDYIKTIGEGGRSHRKLQKFINRQENKFERQMGRNIRKSGLGEVDFRKVEIGGEIKDRRDIDDNQSFTPEQAANDPNVSYAGTFIDFNKKPTRSSSANAVTSSNNGGQLTQSTNNQAGPDKVSAVSGASSVKESMDKNLTKMVGDQFKQKPLSLGDAGKLGKINVSSSSSNDPVGKTAKSGVKESMDKTAAQIVKQNVTRPSLSLSSPSSSSVGKISKPGDIKDPGITSKFDITGGQTAVNLNPSSSTSKKSKDTKKPVSTGNKNKAAASNPESVAKQSRFDYLTSGINPNKKD